MLVITCDNYYQDNSIFNASLYDIEDIVDFFLYCVYQAQ